MSEMIKLRDILDNSNFSDSLKNKIRSNFSDEALDVIYIPVDSLHVLLFGDQNGSTDNAHHNERHDAHHNERYNAHHNARHNATQHDATQHDVTRHVIDPFAMDHNDLLDTLKEVKKSIISSWYLSIPENIAYANEHYENGVMDVITGDALRQDRERAKLYEEEQRKRSEYIYGDIGSVACADIDERNLEEEYPGYFEEIYGVDIDEYYRYNDQGMG